MIMSWIINHYNSEANVKRSFNFLLNKGPYIHKKRSNNKLLASFIRSRQSFTVRSSRQKSWNLNFVIPKGIWLYNHAHKQAIIFRDTRKYYIVLFPILYMLSKASQRHTDITILYSISASKYVSCEIIHLLLFFFFLP